MRDGFIKRLASLAVAVLMISAVAVPAGMALADNSYASPESQGFIIKDYDVQMTVHEDSVYDITETIVCDFTQSKHGIYRSIPISMTIAREDGTQGKAYARVRNFTCSDNWTKDDETSGSSGGVDRSFVARIGDADVLVKGAKTYTLSYQYIFDGDMIKDGDEFYFNIIGTGWQTDIEHASFTIEMPKKFDPEKMGFSIGYWGTEGHQDGEMSYDVNEKIITGETLRTMNYGEGLSIRMELPESYFTSGPAGSSFIWIYYLPIAFALVAFVLWLIRGRDDKIISSVEFGPPEGYNSLDVGMMHHLDATDEDVLSLLIHLANNGYISIEPLSTDGKHIKKHKKAEEFRFKKLKEYDGKSASERIFMNGLFGEGQSQVTTIDLEGEFYKTISAAKSIAQDSLGSRLVVRKGRGLISLLMVAAIFFMVIPVYIYEDMTTFLFAFVPPAAAILYLPFYAALNFGKEKGKISTVLIMIAIALVAVGAPVLLFVLPVLGRLMPAIKILFAIGLVCILIMGIFWGIIQKRTKLGVELAGKAKGLKEFIETAERDRIEAMIEDDPKSFYKMIPYAYVLGVSDKWIKKFEGLKVEPAEWYNGDDALNTMAMVSILNSRGLSSMATVPSSSGGGGSLGGGGGGGFSGGGGGGGGGGSW